MEQHYIVTFCISGEPAANQYTTGVIIKEYPGHPGKLLELILKAIEKDAEESFEKRIHHSRIAIINLTKAN
jgi:hypothetical protein